MNMREKLMRETVRRSVYIDVQNTEKKRGRRRKKNMDHISAYEYC
jgi:hypothetical protein